jgi:N-acetylglucosaminyldiphosphoundecaprenol N-acetyl-beta-D-mannosaminyltransferase
MACQLETVEVGGFETVTADRAEIAQWMAEVCVSNRARIIQPEPVLVFSSNGQGIALQGRNVEFDAAMASADVIHADGMPVVFASRLLTNQPIKSRSATTDLFHDVARKAEQYGLRFFILGAAEDQNLKAVEQMQRLYPRLEIVGRRNGYFSDIDDEDVCKEILASKADILWVGLGKPKQEIWSMRNRTRLAGVSCIKTCGGLYAFLAGDAPRAPKWLQELGMEWLYRLYQEPARLFVRYLVTNSQAAWRLLTKTPRKKLKHMAEK